MNGTLYNQSPTIISVAKHAGAAFIVGAAGASGVIIGLGVGGTILGNIAKKKIIGVYTDFKRHK